MRRGQVRLRCRHACPVAFRLLGRWWVTVPRWAWRRTWCGCGMEQAVCTAAAPVEFDGDGSAESPFRIRMNDRLTRVCAQCPELEQRIRDGVAQAHAGCTHDLGSFAEHLTDEPGNRPGDRPGEQRGEGGRGNATTP